MEDISGLASNSPGPNVFTGRRHCRCYGIDERRGGHCGVQTVIVKVVSPVISAGGIGQALSCLKPLNSHVSDDIVLNVDLFAAVGFDSRPAINYGVVVAPGVSGVLAE